MATASNDTDSPSPSSTTTTPPTHIDGTDDADAAAAAAAPTNDEPSPATRSAKRARHAAGRYREHAGPPRKRYVTIVHLMEESAASCVHVCEADVVDQEMLTQASTDAEWYKAHYVVFHEALNRWVTKSDSVTVDGSTACCYRVPYESVGLYLLSQ